MLTQFGKKVNVKRVLNVKVVHLPDILTKVRVHYWVKSGNTTNNLCNAIYFATFGRFIFREIGNKIKDWNFSEIKNWYFYFNRCSTDNVFAITCTCPSS